MALIRRSVERRTSDAQLRENKEILWEG